MGDRRFDAAYQRIADSRERHETIRALTDREVIHALAAASKRMDAYLANVLATEALDRQARREARFAGVVAGAGLIIVLRTVLIALNTLYPDSPISSLLWLTTSLSIALGAFLGWLVYRARRART